MGYNKYNDYELLYMVRENDDDCKSLLIEKYIPIMKSISFDFYKRFSDYGCDFDDFYIEAQLAFQRAIANFSEDKNILFYTFACVCIENSLKTFCRNLTCKKNGVLNSDTVDITELQIPDLKADIASFVNTSEIEEIVRKTIFNISLEDSSVLELKYNGFCFKDISILLDCPISSVQFRFRRLSKSLRHKLSEYYYK
jgi:RNA polymerase sigma factor (sigma-70 family)